MCCDPQLYLCLFIKVEDTKKFKTFANDNFFIYRLKKTRQKAHFCECDDFAETMREFPLYLRIHPSFIKIQKFYLHYYLFISILVLYNFFKVANTNPYLKQVKTIDECLILMTLAK